MWYFTASVSQKPSHLLLLHAPLVNYLVLKQTPNAQVVRALQHRSVRRDKILR